MNKRTFKSEINKVCKMVDQADMKMDRERAAYLQSYVRGLIRAHVGEQFGTEEEHRMFDNERGERKTTSKGRGT